MKVATGPNFNTMLSNALNQSAAVGGLCEAFLEGKGCSIDEANRAWQLRVTGAELVRGTRNPQTGEFVPDQEAQPGTDPKAKNL
jgi:hypothetical protein